MHKKVAILIRDLRQKGGGETNVLTLTEGLNNIGIIPHIFSENNLSTKELKSFYGKEITYSYKQFPRPKSNNIRFIKELLLPHPLKKTLKTYDFIYDFTNKAPVFHKHQNYLKYLYIYKDNRALQKSKLRLFQFNLYEFLAKLGVKKFIRVSPYIKTVTQSKFAQKEIQKNTGKKLEIIYPPVNTSAFNHKKKKKNQVITIGRCSPEKNQRLIFKIAPHFPELTFIIVGNNCNLLKNKKTKNIIIKNNLPKQKLKNILEKSLVYFSPTKNEHFGIAVVEGIAAGCIPLVHNSGGHKETVPNSELRFNDTKEAITKLKEIIKNPQKFQQEIKVNKKFDSANFVESLIGFLEN